MADFAYDDSMSQALARRRSGIGPRRSQAASRRISRYSPKGASLGLSLRRTEDVIRAVQKGLPFKALATFSSVTGFATSHIASVIEIPERTLARRRVAGRLAPDESERLLRVANVFEKAVELFEGDVAAAATWLTASKKALGDSSPLAHSRFEAGARDVENLIGRLEHGVFT